LKFLKTRDLRQKTAEVLQNIKDEEYVITSNGKPVALLSAVDDDDLELQLQAICRARAELAVYNMQRQAIDQQLDRLTEDEIAAEVKAARRDR
jgi:prevent-host-death family protein